MIYFRAKRYNTSPRVLEFRNKAELLEYFQHLYERRLPKRTSIHSICSAFENDFQMFRRIAAKEARKTA